MNPPPSLLPEGYRGWLWFPSSSSGSPLDQFREGDVTIEPLSGGLRDSVACVGARRVMRIIAKAVVSQGICEGRQGKREAIPAFLFYGAPMAVEERVPLSWRMFFSKFLNALQWGSFYALIALGYSLVYGVLLLINFAHGDIFMVGAYHRVFSGNAACLANTWPFSPSTWIRSRFRDHGGAHHDSDRRGWGHHRAGGLPTLAAQGGFPALRRDHRPHVRPHPGKRQPGASRSQPP